DLRLLAVLRYLWRAASRLDLDLALLRRFGLRQTQAQNAVLEARLGRVALHGMRQGNLTEEPTVASLVQVIARLLALLGGLALALDRQHIALDRDVDVLRAHARHGG